MEKKEKGEAVEEQDLLIYGAYVQVAASLQHSNRIQMQYKAVSSAWLLATFIGVGYSVSSEEPNLPLDPLLAALILAFASLLVIGRIWYLDLIVQEKSIAAAVSAGLVLENQYSWLPQVYNSIVKMQYLLGYVAMKSMFYMALATILILTMCTTLCAYLYLKHLKYWVIVPLGAVILIWIMFYFVNFITRHQDPYSQLSKLKKN